jgi:1-acyl-sn-glycerol-3-phosphate acyltransferase
VGATIRRPVDGPPGVWRLVIRVVRLFLQGVMGWRVRARPPDVVPPPGEPLLVVFNHTSNIDAFLVAATVWKRLQHWVQPLVKDELFTTPGLGILVRNAGAIAVVRGEGKGREAAYDNAVARLRAGGTVLLAPEGTVTHDGSLLPLRHGAARLALDAGVDVLVVTHFGAQRGFSPVVRFAERGVVVTMAMDVLQPWPDEDAGSLTGRIAATMLDRSEQLQATYPQADPDAPWWPPYSAPASPSATARENLERYQVSMAEAVAQARERMARFADDHDVEERLTQARERVAQFADDYDVEERVAQARERALSAAEDLAARSKTMADAFTEQSRLRVDELTDQGRQRLEELTEQGRQLAEELASLARERSVFMAEHLPPVSGKEQDIPPVDPDAT